MKLWLAFLLLAQGMLVGAQWKAERKLPAPEAHQAAAAKPFYLYFPFNHVHAPNSCSAPMCGASARGPVGDAVEEMDAAVGALMEAAIAAYGSTLTLFLSDNGPWLDMAAAGGSARRSSESARKAFSSKI